MEMWSDQGIVLNARAHGEGGAVVSLLTENHGRYSGYMHGGMSTKKRHIVEAGTLVTAQWQARTSENLGSVSLEVERGLSTDILSNSLKLAALISACSLCHEALPEREGHEGLFHGLIALMETMENDHWGAAYIMWEISLLRELGFRLELNKCAANGDPQKLTHVSPKSGRAVSEEKAQPYLDKLLPLAHFLRPEPARGEKAGSQEDIITGLKMTGYFLEHWAFTHHTKGVPEARLLFEERYKNDL